MKYFKNILDGYIVSVSTIQGQTEITEEEYNEILAIIKTMPIAKEGYGYRLREDLMWELIEIPEEKLTNE
jgi:hypothetical protein